MATSLPLSAQPQLPHSGPHQSESRTCRIVIVSVEHLCASSHGMFATPRPQIQPKPAYTYLSEIEIDRHAIIFSAFLQRRALPPAVRPVDNVRDRMPLLRVGIVGIADAALGTARAAWRMLEKKHGQKHTEINNLNITSHNTAFPN